MNEEQNKINNELCNSLVKFFNGRYPELYNNKISLSPDMIFDERTLNKILNKVKNQDNSDFCKAIYNNLNRLYKILIKYKNKKNFVEYFSKNIKTFFKNSDRLRPDRFGNSDMFYFIEDIEALSFNKHAGGLSDFIDKDIPLLFFKTEVTIDEDMPVEYISPKIIPGMNLYYFFNTEIVSTGFKFSDIKLEYCEMVYYLEQIVRYLYILDCKNNSFAKELIKKIFVDGQDRFPIIFSLIKSYDYLFEHIINEDHYSNSYLINFLTSLLDRTDDEIKAYTNLFNKTFIFESKYSDCFMKLKKRFCYEINNELIDFSRYFTYSNDIEDWMKKRKIGSTFILMFLISKDNVEASTRFTQRFKELIDIFSNEHVIINEKLIEFIYSNPEKKIEGIAKI